MSEYYITKVCIDKVRNLNDISIDLSNSTKKHLILTGKNGCGKTSVLNAMKSYLKAIEDNKYTDLLNNSKDTEMCLRELNNIENNDSISKVEKSRLTQQQNDGITYYKDMKQKYGEGLKLYFNDDDLITKYQSGKFVLACFDAHRMTSVDIPRGVEKINLDETYKMNSTPSSLFLKYLVDLKTQQAFAQNEGDIGIVGNIEEWFEKFEKGLKTLMDDLTMKLKFDYRNYNFEIIQNGKESYGFDKLSDGYSSVLNIVMDLILRMENKRSSAYDVEGIVLIDEIETHLHIELQKKIMPFLINFFPKIQFIITTHSPFVLSSIDNAVVYDLEKNIKVEDLSNYSYEGIVEGYFNVDKYSKEIKTKLDEYEKLAYKKELSDDERARRSELKIELKEISSELAVEDKEDAKCLVIRHLKASSPFASFKRWVIKDNRDNLPEFLISS